MKVMPELTDEFVKDNTDYKTADEYRTSVREQLEAEAEENALYNLKNELYAMIYDETEVISYPEGKVEAAVEAYQADYQEIADTYGYTSWDEFRDDYFRMDQAEYEENLKLYAESTVKSELMIYAMAEKEGVVLTEKEYEAELQNMLAEAGFADDTAFKEYSGMSIREYADEYRMDRDFILTECLDIVYDRLTK
jgi:trigger factor